MHSTLKHLLLPAPMKKITTLLSISVISLACNNTADRNTVVKSADAVIHMDSVPASLSANSQQISVDGNHKGISGVRPRELTDFAKTLTGIPYKYASSDPTVGFDCSGFITHVFSHFNIVVPRSSVDFTNVGKEVDVRNAREGDLILFTGTVDSIRIVGHMGIVTENEDTLRFIHSTSGKANGVTISSLNDHYIPRFVKVIRVLSS
jgi:cell wall-associated NlpC family hydrolase